MRQALDGETFGDDDGQQPMDIDYSYVAHEDAQGHADNEDDYQTEDEDDSEGFMEMIPHEGGRSVAQNVFTITSSTNKCVPSPFTLRFFSLINIWDSLRRWLRRGQSVNRRDRIRTLQRNWDDQMPDLASAYLQYKHHRKLPTHPPSSELPPEPLPPPSAEQNPLGTSQSPSPAHTPPMPPPPLSSQQTPSEPLSPASTYFYVTAVRLSCTYLLFSTCNSILTVI